MIYVTGASGQVGSELKLRLGERAVFLSRQELDFSNTEKVTEFLNSSKISLLINAGAFTSVDLAEKEKEIALQVNAKIPALMAKYAEKKKFKLIQLSTDYVFNGKKNVPYSETDQVDPVNYYGESKLIGEKDILEECGSALILRTSWVYSSFGNNFIKTILKYGNEKESLNVVYDQIGTLTSAEFLSQIILKSRDLTGVFNVSNEGVTSWYDVAYELKRLRKIKCSINPVLSHEYPTVARRPAYSVLNKSKIKNALGVTIPHWTENLEECLRKLS